MKKVFKVVISSLVLMLVGLSAFVWADGNGVWHEAGDILPGIFGSDEVAGDYIFEDTSNVGVGVNPISDLDVNGDVRVRGSIVGNPTTGNVVIDLG